MRSPEPVGVVAGVTPVTQPDLHRHLQVPHRPEDPLPDPVFGFHPGAQKCSVEAAKIVRDAAIEAGAPENCIQWIEHPSIESHRRPDEASGRGHDPRQLVVRAWSRPLTLRQARPRRGCRQRPGLR